MNTLFSNISVITMDERMQVLTEAFVGITDGKISWLSKKPPEEKPEKIIDGTGMVLMPGLVNCHTRLTETLLRSFAEDCTVADRLQKCYPRLEQLDRRAAKASALLGIAQCLRMGVTSVSDIGFYPDAVAEAAAEAGIKANIAKELTLASEEEFDFEQDPGCTELAAFAEQWHGYDSGRILAEVGLAPEYAGKFPLWEAAAAFAAEKDLGIHLPLSRYGWEQEDCLDRSGLTPAQLLDCHRVFSRPAVAAHCCHLQEEDLQILGKKKVTAAVCPMTDGKQTAGCADAAAMVKAGMNVALGTGSAAESGSMDLLLQAKALSAGAKMQAEDASFMPAPSVLLMATVCGARAQGRGASTGMIKLGFDADLIALDFTQPHLIPTHDLMAGVLYGAGGQDVCMTMVRGEILYASGNYPTIDLNMLMTELAEHAMPTVFVPKEERDA